MYKMSLFVFANGSCTYYKSVISGRIRIKDSLTMSRMQRKTLTVTLQRALLSDLDKGTLLMEKTLLPHGI